MSKQVIDMVNRIDRRQLKTNSQRVLHSLLRPQTQDGWVARTALRTSSATARIRELRQRGIKIDCVTARDLKEMNPHRCVDSKVTNRQTFYRVDPKSITEDSFRKVFKGVV